jgi:Flp pilus assembly protein TadG
MRSVWGHWLKRKEGTTAVEFALVAFPFIFMTVGIVELALMFMTQSVLHESTFSASRLIRTGQIQQAPGGQQEMFEDAVCDFARLLIPCGSIQYQVQSLPSFSDAEDMPPQFDADGNLMNTGFDPGVENDVVLVRVAYNYPVKTPLMQPLLANNGATRTMFSTIVLRTEPYQ